MFVMTEKGDLYVFKIKEKLPEGSTIDHFNKN